MEEGEAVSDTTAKKRQLLREYMEDCPACVPEEEEMVVDADLDEWLTSHDKDWRERLR